MPPHVKICGLKTADAMQTALAERAEFVGLVFFPKSPRNVPIEAARTLADMARGRSKVVALVVDADDALISEIVAKVNPDMLQLHGEETPARAAELKARFGKPLIKAIKVETAADAARALDYREAADMILFDAKPPKTADRPGGHGATFDWRMLDHVRNRIPFMLSGGLTPSNVAAAIAATSAAAVDVSSGVETAPGIKSPDLIRQFMRAARTTAAAAR